MAAMVRSLNSPLIRPLYSPAQARSNWMAMRSASGIADELSRGGAGGAGGRLRAAAAALPMGPSLAAAGGVSECWAAIWARRAAARARKTGGRAADLRNL